MTVLLTHEALGARGITLSKVRLWQLERAGKFPKRVHVSAGRVAWLADEIDAYLSARIAARRSPVLAGGMGAAA